MRAVATVDERHPSGCVGRGEARLALNTTEHDAFLTDLLRRRLRRDGRFNLAPGVRSAAVYWQVERD